MTPERAQSIVQGLWMETAKLVGDGRPTALPVTAFEPEERDGQHIVSWRIGDERPGVAVTTVAPGPNHPRPVYERWKLNVLALALGWCPTCTRRVTLARPEGLLLVVEHEATCAATVLGDPVPLLYWVEDGAERWAFAGVPY